MKFEKYLEKTFHEIHPNLINEENVSLYCDWLTGQISMIIHQMEFPNVSIEERADCLKENVIDMIKKYKLYEKTLKTE
jgi:hypothetical protein